MLKLLVRQVCLLKTEFLVSQAKNGQYKQCADQN
jgi:hypothetical protein